VQQELGALLAAMQEFSDRQVTNVDLSSEQALKGYPTPKQYESPLNSEQTQIAEPAGPSVQSESAEQEVKESVTAVQVPLAPQVKPPIHCLLLTQ